MDKPIIVASILIVIIVSYLLVKKYQTNKKIKSELEKVCMEYNYCLEKGDKVCDYIISTSNKKIKLVICDIPKNSSVTINSRLTWCLRWGGKRVGRSYPNQRYMNELTTFLKLNKEEGVLKVIALYPQTEKIQKYLNESEIAVVNRGELVYDYKVINFSEINKGFDDLV